MGTGGPFSGAKARPGRDAVHSPPLVPRSWMSRSYTSSPPSAFVACSGTAFSMWALLLVRLQCERQKSNNVFTNFLSSGPRRLSYEQKCCSSVHENSYETHIPSGFLRTDVLASRPYSADMNISLISMPIVM